MARLSAILVPWALLLVAGCGDPTGRGSGSGGARKNASVEKLLDTALKLSTREKKKAVEVYSQAIEIDPQCFKAYQGRGMARDELGDTDGALKDFSKAIEIDPRRSSFPYERRAEIYKKQGKRDQAKADTEMAEAIRNKEWDKLPDKRRQFEDKRKKR